MRLLWLADVLRAAGLTVVEHAGWQNRAAAGSWSPTYGVVHATAAPRSQADDVQARIVRDGRPGLPGPIAVACVDRAGRWHVLAAGRCNTTLVGTAGPFAGQGNTSAIGVEACNDNVTEPWPDVQYDAYVRGWAAICRRLGWAAGRLVGHKEHTPGHKTDPTFNMTNFRTAVTRAMEDDVNITDRVPWPNSKIRARMVAAGWNPAGLTISELLTYTFEFAAEDLAPDELDAVEAAAAEGARAGVLASADALAAAVVARLPPDLDLTKADVEAAVRAVFADAGAA